MYVPPHFRENHTTLLHAAMRAHPLATVITAGPGGLVASHVPMLLVAEPEPFGTLVCHLARANEHWRDVAHATEVLAVFRGPDAYVSPSLYATKRETGKVVPTWNYVAVHAYGRAHTFDDPARLHALVSQLTAAHEAGRDEPWAVSDAPKEYTASQLRAIVGFEIPILRLIGKWKMSQNRPEADRRGTIAGLDAASEPQSRATAKIMAGLEDQRSTGR